MSKNQTLFFSLLFLFSVITPLFAKETIVVAEVGDKKITKEEFSLYYNQNKLFLGDSLVNKQKVLNDMINRQLGILKAQKGNLANDPMVKSKIEDILFHAQVSKDLEVDLKKITVSDSEVEKYYKSNREYRTANILVRLRAEPDKSEIEAAMSTALDIYKKVKEKPELFAEYANKYTQSSAAPTGGDVGFQLASQLPREYYAAIHDQSIGYITPPFRTQMGYHVVKILDVKKASDLNMNVYKKVIYDQKRDLALNSYFEALQKGNRVKIYKENL